MIELLDTGIIVGVMAMGFIFGRSTDKTKTVTVDKIVEKQICFYCRTDMVGAKELDLINHSACLHRTPEEIEALILKRDEEANRIPEKPKHRWYIDVSKVQRSGYPDDVNFWNYESGTRTYYRFRWSIYLNGKEIRYGTHTDAVKARQRAESQLKLEKHKVGDE